MAETTVASEDEEHAIAWAPGLLLSAWAGRVTPGRIAALERALPRLVRASPDGRYCAITVIEPTVSMRFEDDARELSAGLQRRWNDHMICQGYLVEGSGFLPATVRTLTAGLHLVNRADYPLKVFADPWLLARWTAELGALDPAEVLGALSRVRNGLAR